MKWTVTTASALILLVATAFVAWALFSDLGVLAVGHHFYMWRAALAADQRDIDANLQRVLGGTQYGVNMAQNVVREIKSRETRIKLWRRLIALAPNDSWRTYYQYDLEKEFGKGPHAEPSDKAPPN